jgi:hypothetical protein
MWTRRRCLVGLLACAWLFAGIVGLRMLWAYAAHPGDAAATPGEWPGATALTFDQTRPTLVMFIHPMCSCSRASVEELARVLSRTDERAAVHVIAVRPRGTPESWEDSTLIRAVRALPGVKLAFDRTGADAERFGARTSGHVVLYDAGGTLLFSGGITAARGHSGDNAGEDAVVALVNGGSETPAGQASVFGCQLPQKQ